MNGFEAYSYYDIKWSYLHVEMMGGPCHFSCFYSVIHYSCFPEEIQQSKGKESPASGGESRHGRHLCQSGRSQQSNFQ